MPSSNPVQSGGSGEVSNKTFLAVSVCLTCLAGIFVAARVASSWQRKAKKHMHHIDDYITILALLFLSASVAGYNELILAFSDPTMTLDSLMKLTNALTWIGGIMLWGCKVPILVLYITLFGVKQWVKVASYTIITITGIIFLVMSSYVTAKCTGPHNELFLLNCSNASTKAGFVLGVVSIVTDVLIFILPISLVVRLHLPVYKRVGLAIVFAGGLVAIAASAVSTNYKWKSLKWSSSGGTNDMICTIVECAVALMVACVPGVYSLWSHTIVTSGFYSKLSSAISQVFLARSRPSGVEASDASARSNKSRPSTASMKLVALNNGDAFGRKDSYHQVQEV